MARLILIPSCFVLILLLSSGTRVLRNMGPLTFSNDIGNPKIKGSTHFDKATQIYTLSGGGLNMWANQDEFHFASVEIGGDFILTAFCHFLGKGVNPHRKMGLMIRENSESGSRYADAAIHGDGLTSLQYRSGENDMTYEFKSALKSPDVIQLERKGDTIIMRCAKSGNPFFETGRVTLGFKTPVYAGLFVCSHDTGVVEKASFHNFRIDVPAGDRVDGYQHPSASRLELLDVATGNRKVIYTTTGHIEAPNWSHDGKFLIYNSEGLLYKFPLTSKIPVKINTAEIVNLNNDHGLSFDGKMLAISSTAKMPDGHSGSMVYTVPVSGGIPKPITPKVPSYWHGWSPDGKRLVYCAERNGDYDVWRIPSGGGEEIQLTKSTGLDDGPEYSPDGHWIYFNSVRSGMMKIWRMLPDGSNPEQVSFGPYNDWFAHLSPDGKRMVYVSYPANIPPNSHPHNQRVILQLQETNSAEQKVLAYIYGGQGTMNVPSWSPDGKMIAFVSFTYGDPNF